MTCLSTNGSPTTSSPSPASGASSNGSPSPTTNRSPANGSPANGSPANGSPANGSLANGSPANLIRCALTDGTRSSSPPTPSFRGGDGRNGTVGGALSTEKLDFSKAVKGSLLERHYHELTLAQRLASFRFVARLKTQTLA